MILWIFIEFFGVKIVIIDIYRYFTDIIFQKFQHKRAYSTVAIFQWKNRYFPFFRRKIDDFTDFFSRFFLCFFFSVPVENRFFDDISIKKTIFYSLGTTLNKFYLF